MLEIEDLETLSKEEILKALAAEGSNSFEIAFGKSTQEFFSERNAISIEYANLAYVGQRLSEIASDFQYSEVPPAEHESVIFTITVSDIKLLAETLMEIAHGDIEDDEDEDFGFDEMILDFLDKVEQGEVNPACPYFIEVYKEYIDEGE